MPELISGDAFTDLFRRFEHTAFRLETRRAYGVAYEFEPYRLFLEGKDPGIEWLADWLELMREQTALGKRVERVRLIDDPPSDYLRFSLHCTPHNLAAGEDIRYLARAEAERLDLPEFDYWLFDSRLVARFHYDGDRSLGVTLHEDPAAVVVAAAARDAAWHHALTLAQYQEQAAART